MDAVSSPSILERVVVELSEKTDDELVHYFCKCGLKANPHRARCGKVKLDWVLCGDYGNICVVCEELRRARTCDCDYT